MTLPKVTSDLLIFPPSFSLSPVAPVALARSLHAKKLDIAQIWVRFGQTDRQTTDMYRDRQADTPPSCKIHKVKPADSLAGHVQLKLSLQDNK